jgi:ApaG protein
VIGMDESNGNLITVNVDTRYLEDQSDPDENRFVFAYTITIRNRGTVPAKLLTRHWVITDANGKVQEVRGEGVVGEQPHLMAARCSKRRSAPCRAATRCSPITA